MTAPTVKDLPCADAQIRAGQTANGGCAERAKPWVLAATILGSSLAFIDGSVVNVALPAMQQQLSASLGEMQWVVNAYTLLLAALILLGGAAGDRFGRRRVRLSAQRGAADYCPRAAGGGRGAAGAGQPGDY